MTDIKKIKEELLTLDGSEPPEAPWIQNDDFFDMALKLYFNPAAHRTQEEVITSLTEVVNIIFSFKNQSVTESQVKALLDKHTP